MIEIAVVVIVLLVLFISVIVNPAKYEYIPEYHEPTPENPYGSWTIEPVMLECGEVLDKDYIEEWNRRNREYAEWRKKYE